MRLSAYVIQSSIHQLIRLDNYKALYDAQLWNNATCMLLALDSSKIFTMSISKGISSNYLGLGSTLGEMLVPLKA